MVETTVRGGRSMRCEPATVVTRIAWRYLDAEEAHGDAAAVAVIPHA